jgi:uncharacterized protein (DUF2062 family)
VSRRWLGRWLPTQQTLRAHRVLRRFDPLLSRPGLWRLDRRSVAAGAAAGVFFGFLIPIAQIPLAALASWLMRANLPVAVASTLVSNPFTYVPIYWLAHETGQALLGAAAAVPQNGGSFAQIGLPLFTGLASFAVAGALLAYAGVHLVWRLALWIYAVRRRRRKTTHPKDLSN